MLAGGEVVEVGRWAPTEGEEPRWWAATVDADAPVLRARMRTPDGTVWATADLT